MWPFCGTEHYGVDSANARWQTGYTQENRPIEESGWDIDRWAWERKRSQWKPMHLVPASSWLQDTVQSSALMGVWSVTRIPHVVDTDAFAPMGQREARQLCGLPDSSPLILFLSSAGIADRRKGFDQLEEALETVRHEHRDLRVVVAGPPMPDYTPRSGVPILWMGGVEGDARLRSLYCSADLLVVPSREDNMPLTAMEAQSCGVPVVAFDVGGLRDIIVDGVTGLLAASSDSYELADAVTWLLTEQPLRRSMALQATVHARQTWSPSVVAKRYSDLYTRLESR